MNRNTSYKVLALAAGTAAILAACNFPGLGGRQNTANATNTVSTGPLSGAAGNAIGLDSGSGMDMPGGNTASLPPVETTTPAPANLPSIRAGRWMQTSSTNNNAPETETVCLQGGPLQMTFARECPTPAPQPGPNGTWVIQTSCTGRLGPVDVRMSSQGDYQNHYSMDAQFSLRPTDPNMAPRSVSIHMEAVYQGPCQGNERTGPRQDGQDQDGQDQGGQDQGGEEGGGDK